MQPRYLFMVLLLAKWIHWVFGKKNTSFIYQNIVVLSGSIHLDIHSFTLILSIPFKSQKDQVLPAVYHSQTAIYLGQITDWERKGDLTGQTSKPDSQKLKCLPSVNLIRTLKYLPQNKTTYIDIYKVCMLQDYASAHWL